MVGTLLLLQGALLLQGSFSAAVRLLLYLDKVLWCAALSRYCACCFFKVLIRRWFNDTV
jgi:hypothetical protein